MDQQSRFIGVIKPLSQFIKQYPDQNLHKSLWLMESTFPLKRSVKGDGNCFYRAFGFSYISTVSSTNFRQVFPQVTWRCKNNRKIPSNQQFQKMFQIIWGKHLEPLLKSNLTRIEKQNKLSDLFNNVQNFDDLIIGYFRSANYEYIQKHIAELLPFAQNMHNLYKILQRIQIFGQQSEGIQLNSLPQAMRTRIVIICVDDCGFQPMEYGAGYPNKQIYIFFRPGHYDISYMNNQNNQNTPNGNRMSQQSFRKSNKNEQNIKKKQNRSSLFSQINVSQSTNERQSKQNSFFSSKKSDQQKKQAFRNIQNTTEQRGSYDLKFSNVPQPIPKQKQKLVVFERASNPLNKIGVQALGLASISIALYFLYSLGLNE